MYLISAFKGISFTAQNIALEHRDLLDNFRIVLKAAVTSEVFMCTDVSNF